MLFRFIAILATSSSLVFSQWGFAVTVHTWKDANGVTHFSDEPAPEGVTADTVELDKFTDNNDAASEDFYSIANQWQRLKAERDETRARREAKAQRRAAERQAAFELQAAREANQAQSHPVFVGPVNGRGIWSGGPLPYGQRGLGFRARDSFGRGHRNHRDNGLAYRKVHPNYYSPFHDRAQPQAIRPKSFSNHRSAYRARSSGGHAGFFVRF